MRVNVYQSAPSGKRQSCSFTACQTPHKASIHFCLASLLLLSATFTVSLHASTIDTTHDSIAAARLNNTGVALMNQQLMEKALAKFDEAHKINPTAAVPILNQGIAA